MHRKLIALTFSALVAGSPSFAVAKKAETLDANAGKVAANITQHKLTPFTKLQQAIQLPEEDTNREKLLQETLAEAPGYADAAHRLGGYYQVTGQYDLAASHFDRAMGNDPHNKVYAERRAKLYALMGRYSEGIARFQAEFKKDNTRTHLLGHIVSLQADLERYEAARVTATAWTKLDAQNSDAWRWLGTVLTKAGNYEGALQALNTAVELSQHTENLKALQVVFLESEDHAQGVETFTALTAKYPTSEQAWLFLSELHRANGDLAKAELAANKRAELLGPDTNVDALNTMASVLEAGGSFEEALRRLFTAEKLKQADEFVHDRIKDLIFKLDRTDDGIDYFLREFKTTQKPHVARVLGELFSKQQNWEKAKFWQAQYLGQKPYSALGYAQFGRSMYSLGDKVAAKEAFEKAAWFDLGIRDNFHRVRTLFLENKDLPKGVEFFEAVTAYLPEKAELHLYLADLYQASGLKAEAAAALQRAAELKPVTLAPELKARIAGLLD